MGLAESFIRILKNCNDGFPPNALVEWKIRVQGLRNDSLQPSHLEPLAT